MGAALNSSETIGEELERAETVILGLRLVEGIRPGEFFERFGVTLESLYQPQIDEMVAAGLLERCGDVVRLTQRGRLLGNEVFQRFLPTVGVDGLTER